jgi:hypothetical protein
MANRHSPFVMSEKVGGVIAWLRSKKPFKALSTPD